MPWLASAPGDLTILRAPGRRLTKLITPDGVVDYDRTTTLEVAAVRLDDIDDLAKLLEQLAGQTDTCIIRARLLPQFAGQRLVLRRSRRRPGEPARFEEVPRSWIMVDLENLPCPVGVAPDDPVLTGGALRMHLPAPFRVARCVVQLSSQAGLSPGLRGHLWFTIARPLVRAEIVRWLGGVPGVDLQVYVPVQPHYCASPRFDGIDDPCHERLAVLPGYPEVAVPPLPEQQRPRATSAPVSIGRAGPARAEAYAQACLRRLASAPRGARHRTCLTVSCRLLALAKSGQLDATRVASQIKGVMVGKGFDGRSGRDLSEIDSILQWAWDTVKPEGLPHAR
jgi:hypothetical protein